MSPENPDEKDESEQLRQLEQLRRRAYNDPDCTSVIGTLEGRKLAVPIGKALELEVIEGPRKGLKYRFPKGNIIIGRAPEADVVVEDDKISRKHAIIEAFARDQVFISDLASTNGTFVNGMRVRSLKLKNGDEIRIGYTVMKFSSLDTES